MFDNLNGLEKTIIFFILVIGCFLIGAGIRYWIQEFENPVPKYGISKDIKCVKLYGKIACTRRNHDN